MSSSTGFNPNAPCQNAPAPRQNCAESRSWSTANTLHVRNGWGAQLSHETLRHIILQQRTRLCRMCLGGDGMHRRARIVIWYKRPISVSALDRFIRLD